MEGKLDDVEVGKEQWQRVIDAFTNHSPKKWPRLKKKWRKSRLRMNQLDLIVKCGSPMVIKLGRFGKFYACSNFPDCRHTQAIVKEIGVEVQVVIRDKSLSAKPSVTVSSMVAIAIQNVNLPLGISLLVVTVQKCGNFLMEKKSPWWWQAGCM